MPTSQYISCNQHHPVNPINNLTLSSLMAPRWLYMYEKIHTATDVAVHLVQQVQHHCLAVDLLLAEDLSNLFSNLSTLALCNGCQLLPKLALDLFQEELSYFYDGHQLVLIYMF